MTIYYSILFSLGDAKANQYVYCLMLQLRALVRTKMLGALDQFVLLCDQKTQKVMEGIAIPPNFKMLLVPSPKTLEEGMMLKFAFPRLAKVPEGEQLIYMDLDMLPIRKIEIDVPANSFVAYPEGRPDDKNYCGDSGLALPAGCSGGFFAYRWCPAVAALFQEVLERIGWAKEKYYTLDQPHYNRALAAHIACVKFFPHEIVSFNGNTNQKTAAFINCCGDPGDSGFHFRKMLEFFLRAL